MKRIISILLILAMLVPSAFAAEEGQLAASASFGKSGADASGMTVTCESDKEVVSSEQNGKECWQLGVNKDENCYIDMNITAGGANSFGNYRLEVTYLDEGHGHFVVRYNSFNGEKKSVTKLENSGKWKTASIPLMRTGLSNSLAAQAGGKCAISLRSYDQWGYEYSNDPVYVSGVKLYVLGTEDRADITVETSGIDLNFTDGDAQNIKYTVQNTMSDKAIDGTITYTAFDEDNNTLWTSSDTVKLSANRGKRITIAMNVKKYGVHKLRIELNDAENNIYSMAEQEFALYRKNTHKKEGFGVSSHFCWGSGGSVITMPMFENMGTSVMRDELYWKTYEQEMGVYKLPDAWNNYINEAIKRGIEPLIILDFGNKLYTATDDTMPTEEGELKAFGNYVYNLVSDLKGRVKYFEVWNEPNLAGVETGVQYARLLKVAYNKVKEANPEAKVVGFAQAGVSPEFMDYMAQEDPNIFTYMDLASFHEYCKGKPPENSTYTGIVTYCAQKLRERCGDNTEIWLTEMGLSENEIGITEKEAAEYAVRSVLWNDAEKLYKNIFYYTWINGTGSEGFREANFGLLNQDYTAKKGYVAYTAMSYFLGGASFEKRDIDANANHVFDYSKTHNDIQVAFNAEDKESEVTLTPKFGAYTLYDMYGNEISSGNAETVTVSTSGAPVYLVSSVDGANMNYANNTVNIIGEIEGAEQGEQAMIYVLSPGKGESDIFTSGALSYIDQITLGEGGTFEYSFPLSGGAGIYKIYIGYSKNPGLTAPIMFEVKRDVSASAGLYAGDVKIESVSELGIEGIEKLTAKGIINNRYNADINAGLYAAAYSNAGKLLWTEMLNRKAAYSEADILSFDMDIKSFEGVDKVKVFLWADNGAPLCGADIID